MNKSLGEKIKFFRTRAKTTQLQLELMLDASIGSVSRMEGGLINPTKETLIKIAEALQLNDVETSYLFGLEYQPLNPDEIAKIKSNFTTSFNDPNYLAYILDNRSVILDISKGFENLFHHMSINTRDYLGRYILDFIIDYRDILDNESFYKTVLLILQNLKLEKEFLIHDPIIKSSLSKAFRNKEIYNLFQNIESEQINPLDKNNRTITLKYNGIVKTLSFNSQQLPTDRRYWLIEYSEM